MSRYYKKLCSIYFAITCLTIGLCVSPAFAAEKSSYTLAVIPNMPAVTLHKNWTPFVEYLSRELGVKIELKLYDKIGTFLDESQAGQADFIYSAPNMYYLAYQKQKYVPLVRSATMIQGRVFVRKDSPYTKVSELQGKKIAFVGPKNVCSIITRQALLTGQGSIDYNASFSGSTVNVAKSVLLGKVDAGASLDVSMMSDVPEMANEFRVILETEKIASHPLAAHPRVPKELQDALTAAVLALDSSAQGKKILGAVKLTKPIRADFKRDYSFFSEFDFERLDKQKAN
jgi:phosphonate transport system substrate-binding protein